MPTNPFTLVHLFTILPAIAIGTFLMLSHKGNNFHRLLGKIYMVLMLITGVATLFMEAFIGPKLFGHFGFIHLFSVLTLYSVPQAYFAAKRHDVKEHRGAMVGLYVGGIIIAGIFAFMPGRTMYGLLFG